MVVVVVVASREVWVVDGVRMVGVSVVSRVVVDADAAAAVAAAPDAESCGSAAVPALAAASLSFFPLTPLKTSRGKSAMAMVRAPMSPTSAMVTAEMGSQGCSSVLCSTERYL